MKNWLDDLKGRPMARNVAWAGELVFAGANESDRGGRTVRFTVVRSAEEKGQAHPFAAHTMRRKGFAGTRFQMALTPFEECRLPEFLSEVILLGWTDGPKGATVTFGLPLDDIRLKHDGQNSQIISGLQHPFIGCTRAAKGNAPSRWMAVFVELNDEDAPVDQVQRAKVEKPKQKIRNSNLAAQFIKNPRFHEYLERRHGAGAILSAADADRWLKVACAIESKAQLDSEPTAAEVFDLLRQDFVDWQIARGYDTTQ